MKKINRIEKLSIIILFIVLIIFMFLVPNIDTDINVGKLIINEVMTVNNSTIFDKYGNNSDYIELYNGNDYDINLYGYYLTDSMKDTRKWSFPDVTIKKGDYLVIFASGKNEMIDNELHANFKLDSKGETIALSDSSAKVISKVYVKETLHDTSYGFNGDKYVYYYNGTPGKENTSEYTDDAILEVSSNYQIRINEYMTNNISLIKSFDNKFYSMIELYNYGNEDVNLNGFYLSDKEDNLNKYTFPEVIIKKNDYLVVYASSLDKIEKDEIHTNFKLNGNDGTIILSSPNKSIIDKVNIQKSDNNKSFGLYDKKWYQYRYPSFGKENKDNYQDGKEEVNIIINEASIYPKEAVELKNNSNYDINLKGYYLTDKSGKKYDLSKYTIKKNGYLVLSNLNFGISVSGEIIYLNGEDGVIDSLEIKKLRGNVSVGKDGNNIIYYKNITLGSENSSNKYLGFALEPIFSINSIYVKKDDKVSIKSNDNSTIYYTTDGTFPNSNSKKYTEPITINKNMVIKTIAYKDNYLESDVVSQTFIIDNPKDVAVISISSDYNSLFGGNGIITNYTSNSERKASFEFYEDDGTLAVNEMVDIKLSGMDSRKEPQKSISVYLRKRYGKSKVTYPFFKDISYDTFSSLLLRNAGEDPKNVRIMDAALTRVLKGEMDLDYQEYRPVAVYLNGSYYGLYNLREKLNGDYVESKFGIDKDNIDLIKYSTPVKGNLISYNNIVNYINSHNTANKDVYEYIKTQIDVNELANYWIVESYYGNTDLGNIRYWKDKNGKWRWMIYDLDWSLWNTSINYSYPVKNINIPAATYLYSSINIARRLYQNSEFKDLYLTNLAKFLKLVKPERFNKIIDDLVSEVESEMPNHIKRWQGNYPYLSSMNAWRYNISSFKNSLNNRYKYVVANLKNSFNLSNNEYTKYFGDLK